MSDKSVYDKFSEEYQKRKDKCRSRLLQNRDRILQALKNLEITSVVVSYSGSGDDGQINDVELFRGKQLVEIEAEVSVIIGKSKWDPEKSTWINYEEEDLCPFSEAIRDFVYDWIESEYTGWENNDGASGECMIEVATAEFSLEHITYYT